MSGIAIGWIVLMGASATGDGTDTVTVNSMIEQLAHHLGREPIIEHQPTVATDMKDTAAEISKAGKLLGWQPETTPAEGFRQTAVWHLGNAEWLGEITP